MLLRQLLYKRSNISSSPRAFYEYIQRALAQTKEVPLAKRLEETFWGVNNTLTDF